MSANYKKYEGNGLTVELHRQGAVVSYVMKGSGISENVGTARMTDVEILDVLLAPVGMKVNGNKIVSAN